MRIKQMAEMLISSFESAGLLQRESRSFQLHMTLINTKYFKQSRQGKHGKSTFDATQIFDKHKDDFFGKFPINTVRLCRMSGGDGETYPIEAEIKL